MTEMIDQVGEAILRALEGLNDADINAGLGALEGIRGIDLKRLLGHAAIEAMREPTEGMARGAQATGMGLVTPEARKEMFTAMIDAALTEPTP